MSNERLAAVRRDIAQLQAEQKEAEKEIERLQMFLSSKGTIRYLKREIKALDARIHELGRDMVPLVIDEVLDHGA